MGISIITAAAVSILVGSNCLICSDLIDKIVDDSPVAYVLKIISAICLFGGFQMGLIGLCLFLVS